MKKSKKIGIIAGIIIFVVLLYAVFLFSISNPSECKSKTDRFDQLATIGCVLIDYDEDNTAGATLISSTYLSDFNDGTVVQGQYKYFGLILKGNKNQANFVLAMDKDVSFSDFSYQEGRLYQFNYEDLCGSTFTAGPMGGGGIFIDSNFTELQPLVCE